MKAGELLVEVRADTTQAQRQISKGIGDASKEAGDAIDKNVTDGAKRASSGIGQLLGAAAFGAVIKGAVDAASDLNEAISRTSNVFGDLDTDIREFAAGAAEAIGQSERAALEAANSFGTLLQNLGFTGDEAAALSIDLTTLSSDLASAFNKDPEEAVLALGSALRGETEPIRQFGVVINEAAVKQKALELGLHEGTGALDINAKAQATLALVMEQTASAQGDFARTADGAANAQRIAKAQFEDAAATLGNSLLPAFTKIIQVVSTAAEIFGDLPAPIQLAIVGLAGIAALAGPIGGMVSIVKSLGTAVFTANPAFLALGVVAVALGAAFSASAAQQAAFKARVEEVSAALRDQTGTVQANIAAITSSTFATDAWAEGLATLGVTSDELSGLISGSSGDLREYADRLVAAGDASGELLSHERAYLLVLNERRTEITTAVATEANRLLLLDESSKAILAQTAAEQLNAQQLAEFNSILADGVVTQKEASDANFNLTQVVGDATRAYDEQKAAVETVARVVGEVLPTAFKDAAGATDEFVTGLGNALDAANDIEPVIDEEEEALREVESAFQDAANAANIYKQALDLATGGSLTLEEASLDLLQQQADLTTTIQTNGTTLDQNTEAGRANREQIVSNVASILDYGAAMVGAGASNDEATAAVNAQIGTLRQQLLDLGFTEAAADEYIATLGLTPTNISTALELANRDLRIQQIRDYVDNTLNGVPDEIKTAILADLDEGSVDEAERRLRELARDRLVNIVVQAIGGALKSGTTGTRSFGGAADITALPQSFTIEAPIALGAPTAADLRGSLTGGVGGSGAQVFNAQFIFNGDITGDDELDRRFEEWALEIMRRFATGVRG